MIVYGICVIPLILELQEAHTCVNHPWYADDAGARSIFGNLLTHFKELQVRGSLRGYFPEPTKNISVIASRNVARSEDLFWVMGMVVVTGIHYLGSFSKDQAT